MEGTLLPSLCCRRVLSARKCTRLQMSNVFCQMRLSRDAAAAALSSLPRLSSSRMHARSETVAAPPRVSASVCATAAPHDELLSVPRSLSSASASTAGERDAFSEANCSSPLVSLLSPALVYGDPICRRRSERGRGREAPHQSAHTCLQACNLCPPAIAARMH